MAHLHPTSLKARELISADISKSDAVKKALENTAYIGSHRHSAIIVELRKQGYRIVKL